MKIKNISVKPICIGDVSLLPGETAQVETVYADAVAFYISMGYVQEVAEKKTRGKATIPVKKLRKHWNVLQPLVSNLLIPTRLRN